MNTDRELGRLLRSEMPPPHRKGFWDDLRHDLDDAGEPSAPVVDIRSFARRVPLLAVAAAAVVIALVVGVSQLRDDGADVDVDVAGPSSTEDVSPDASTPAATAPLVVDGDATERGTGRVLGVSADGRWLYVADDAGGDDTGCEGAERQAVYVSSIDGGERRLATSESSWNATTMSTLHFDGAGRVAAVVQCEGFDSSIVTASVADDGTFVDVEELAIPEPECHDGSVDGITDIAYTAPGQLVAATMSLREGTASCQHLFALPDTASEATLIGDSPVYLVEATPDGRLVTATFAGRVSVDGEVLHEMGDGGVAGLSLAPSGAVVAVSGGDAGAPDVVVPLDGGDAAPFADEAYEVVMVDDVNGVGIADVDGRRAVVTFRAGDPDGLSVVVTGNVSTFVVTPGGDRLLVTVTDEAGEAPRVLEFALTR